MKLSLSVPGQRRKLGEILIEEKLVTPELLEAILAQQKLSDKRLGTLLVEMGILTRQQFMRVLSKQMQVVHHNPAGRR